MRLVILGLLILISVLQSACTPAASPTATPAPSPTRTPPAPTPTAVPTPEASYVSICNTGGIGAYIRTEPKGSGIVAWPEGTRLKLAGPDRNIDGEVWRNVQDQKGAIGWTKTDYLCD